MNRRCYLLFVCCGALLQGQAGSESKAPAAYSRAPDLANVAYGSRARQVLDLWKAKSEYPAPLVVYFHPGGSTGPPSNLPGFSKGT